MGRKSTALTVVAAGLLGAAAVLWWPSPGPDARGADRAADAGAPDAALTDDAARTADDAAPDGAAGPAAVQDAGTESPADTLTPAQRAVRLHRRADRGPEQPVPFSHRFHVSEVQLECQYCHTGSRESQVAVMPPLSTCMGCHRVVGQGIAGIDTLRAYWSRDEPVPWERVYKVPEFVQFKHQPHLRNGVECQECHGPVEEMDRVYKASSLSMGWCLACHRQEPQPGDVATDYRLAREAEVPQSPEGRQPIGLYPYRISSGYAAYRAPDDCATCHY